MGGRGRVRGDGCGGVMRWAVGVVEESGERGDGVMECGEGGGSDGFFF